MVSEKRRRGSRVGLFVEILGRMSLKNEVGFDWRRGWRCFRLEKRVERVAASSSGFCEEQSSRMERREKRVEMLSTGEEGGEGGSFVVEFLRGVVLKNGEEGEEGFVSQIVGLGGISKKRRDGVVALQLLIACLDDQARDEGTNVDLKMVEEDAKQLYQDGKKIWGTNDRTFTKGIRPHLVAVDAAYHKMCQESCKVLYNAMKGAGTSDTTLTRTVVTSAGIDMEDVKKKYAQAYKKSVKDAIHKDTSGDYRTFLISLVE
ncbi:hypothetical protein AAC387_Pa02g5061 [Persea americana]